MPLIVILKILRNQVCGKVPNPRWRPRWRLADTSFKVKYDYLTNEGRNNSSGNLASKLAQPGINC